MKVLTLILTILLNASIGFAYDFSYSISDPSSSTADDYIVSKSNVEIIDEGTSVYWKQDVGATLLEKSEPGTVIYRFDFQKPIAQGNFFTRITTFNWSYSKGHSFIYASKDGVDWIKLAEATPPPDNGGYNIQSFNNALPSEFIGSQQVWIKVELNSYGTSASYGGAMTNTAQHLRYEKAKDNTTFKLEVDFDAETGIDPDTIPVPTVNQIYDYSPVASPVTGADPEVIKPVSIGSAAEDGSQLDLEVALNAFKAPVDLYFGLHATGLDPNEIFLFNQEGGLIAMSQYGLMPWKEEVTASIDETILSLPAASLPEGTYTFFLMATSTNQSEPFLLWSTAFNHNTEAFFVDQFVSSAEGAVIEESGVRMEILPDSLPNDIEISAYVVPEQTLLDGDEFLGGIRFSPSDVELENMALVEVPIVLPADWDENESISIYEFFGDDPSLSAWNGYHASLKVVEGQTIAIAPVFHFSGIVFVRNCHSGTFKYMMDQFEHNGCDPAEVIKEVVDDNHGFKDVTVNSEKVTDPEIQMFLDTFFIEKNAYNAGEDIEQSVIDEMSQFLDQGKQVVLSFKSKHTAALEKKEGRVQIRNSANLSDNIYKKLKNALGGTNVVYYDWKNINEFRELQSGVPVELACGLNPGELSAEGLNRFRVKAYGWLTQEDGIEYHDTWENWWDKLVTGRTEHKYSIRQKPWRAVKIYVQKESLEDFCDELVKPCENSFIGNSVKIDEFTLHFNATYKMCKKVIDDPDSMTGKTTMLFFYKSDGTDTYTAPVSGSDKFNFARASHTNPDMFVEKISVSPLPDYNSSTVKYYDPESKFGFQVVNYDSDTDYHAGDYLWVLERDLESGGLSRRTIINTEWLEADGSYTGNY